MTQQLQQMFANAGGGKSKTKKMKVREAYRQLVDEEALKMVDEEAIKTEAVYRVEQDGIVFLDELDKVCKRGELTGADVSREGVQRDLLPLIEGTTVSTKYGPVKTDHVLFIASGAFHVSKPSDLLPELQGRLPIRVELRALTEGDHGLIVDLRSGTYMNLGKVPGAITATVLTTEGKVVSPRPRHSALALGKIKATGFVPRDADEALARSAGTLSGGEAQRIRLARRRQSLQRLQARRLAAGGQVLRRDLFQDQLRLGRVPGEHCGVGERAGLGADHGAVDDLSAGDVHDDDVEALVARDVDGVGHAGVVGADLEAPEGKELVPGSELVAVEQDLFARQRPGRVQLGHDGPVDEGRSTLDGVLAALGGA